MRERISTQEVAKMLGCKRRKVYRLFSDKEGTASITYDGYTIDRVRARPEEGGANTRWRFHVSKDGERLEPAHDQSVIQQWQSLRSQVVAAQKEAKEVQKQAQEADILDQDTWDIIASMRQDALKQVEQARQEVVDFVMEHAQHLYVATEKEQEDPDWLCGPEDLEGAASSAPKGPSALIYGGQPRQQRIKKIEDALDFETVDWVDSQKDRKVQSAITRVQNGAYDVVFCLKDLASHKPMDQLKAACKDQETVFIRVDHGQSIGRITKAYEAHG